VVPAILAIVVIESLVPRYEYVLVGLLPTVWLAWRPRASIAKLTASAGVPSAIAVT
jgi:hypothetical protein